MNILIPTDFSENAYKALAYVYDHFKSENLNITLIHTIKQPASTAGVMLRLEDLMKEDAERDMAALLKRIIDAYNDAPEFIIRYGYLKDWVEQVSDVTVPDLIVMGTKGENNVGSKLMGSVTESIVRTSKIPVLAVPNSNRAALLHTITIATALDDIPNADFLRSFMENIKDTNVRLEVLRVLTSEEETVNKSISIENREIGVQAIRNETPIDGINEYIASHEISMLGVYHSHTTRLDYFFNRSVTKRICAHVELPILVMRGTK